jgi:hypothetical protein
MARRLVSVNVAEPTRTGQDQVSDKTYFIRENDKDFTFNSDAGGEVLSLSFKDSNGVITAKKLHLFSAFSAQFPESCG